PPRENWLHLFPPKNIRPATAPKAFPVLVWGIRSTSNIRFAVEEAVSFLPARLDLRAAKSSQHLPREISSQPRLNVSLTPRGLQILLALCCIAVVETTLPIHELKGSTLLSRRNQPPHYATAPGAGKFRVKPT